MKIALVNILFLLSLTSFTATAQPGDDNHEIRLRYYHAIQDSIKANPAHLFYKWVRLDLLFDPYFNLQTKPTETLDDFLRQNDQFELFTRDSIIHASRTHYMSREVFTIKKHNPAKAMGDFLRKHQQDLIADLNELIAHEVKFENRFMGTVGMYTRTADQSNFRYKRGQFYYATGRPEKALNDFEAALRMATDKALTERIYLSIIAYYLTIEQEQQPDKDTLALHYIRRAEPVLEDSSCFKGEEPHRYTYESKKLALMKAIRDSSAYVNYLQNRTAGYLNYYYALLGSTNPEDQGSTTLNRAFGKSREYELMIYDYLMELNPATGAAEFIKHKKEIIDKL